MVLAEVMRECDDNNNLSRDCVCDGLLEVKNYQGVAGPLSFDENGISERETYLIQFGGDGMEVIK